MRLLIPVAAAALVAGCARTPAPAPGPAPGAAPAAAPAAPPPGPGAKPAPGYSGGVPSGKGQDVLRSLEGKVLKTTGGTLGTGSWTIGGFGVVPNKVTGKGPVISLGGPDGTSHDLPVDSDVDVAVLYKRVTGQAHPDLPAGAPGPNFLKVAGPDAGGK